MTGGSPKPPADSPFRRQPLVFVLLAVVAGILADARLDWPIVCEWLAAAVGLIAWAWMWSRGCQGMAAVFLVVGIASTAAAWHQALALVSSR